MKPQAATPSALNGRSGTTLTEVLMSIMIMSIGVVALASLFPISVLRTLQATQLTNATILRYNTEAMLRVAPDIVLSPDGTGVRSSFLGNVSPPGNPPNPPNPSPNPYIVDPLGWHELPSALQGIYGNDGAGATVGNLKRYAGSTALSTNQSNARIAVTLPDSWVDYSKWDVNTTFSSSPADSLTLPATADLSGVPTNGSARVTLFDATGKVSHTRPINNKTGAPAVQWAVDLPFPFTAQRALIQIQEQRYTWLLTVRNNDAGVASVDVVIFFRRSFDPQDEVIFSANFVKDNRQVTLGSGAQSQLKKGGYLLDPSNGLWYRIENFRQQGSGMLVDLGSSIRKDSVGSGGAIVPKGVVDVYPIPAVEPTLRP